MSLAVEVEIESTDTAVKRRTQALIDCGATGCFIDIEWAKLNNIPTRPLTNSIPIYNVDGTTNDTGVVNSVLLPSIALNCLPGCCTRMFNCSGILD
jgi:hypothetical protein